MIALYILGGLLLLLLAVLLLPLSVWASFGETLTVAVKLGPVKKVVLPKSNKTPKKKKAPADRKEKTAQEHAPKKKRTLPKPTFDDICALLSAVWRGLQRMLRRMGRNIVLDPVSLHMTVGGSDPAKTAEMFGYANAAMWTVLPYLQETLRLPHPRVHVGMDFDAPATKVEGELGLRFCLGGILLIAFGLIGPVAAWAIPFLRRAKKAAKQAAAAKSAAAQQNSVESDGAIVSPDVK